MQYIYPSDYFQVVEEEFYPTGQQDPGAWHDPRVRVGINHETQRTPNFYTNNAIMGELKFPETVIATGTDGVTRRHGDERPEVYSVQIAEGGTPFSESSKAENNFRYRLEFTFGEGSDAVQATIFTREANGTFEQGVEMSSGAVYRVTPGEKPLGAYVSEELLRRGVMIKAIFEE